MVCRIHYRWQGRSLTKDVAATKADAPGVFKHLFPRCVIDRVEELGHATAAPKVIPRTDRVRKNYHPITDKERAEAVEKLRAFRKHLARS